jgi:hypothetical protein
MKKLLIFGILVCFLASCSNYQPIKQTWVPNKHKPSDFTKPKTKKRKN